jgi:hypothetical protein
LCEGMGYFGSVHQDGERRDVWDYIPKEGPVTARQFVDWLSIAEGFPGPDLVPLRQQRKLRRAFIEITGAEIVDARWLQ